MCPVALQLSLYFLLIHEMNIAVIAIKLCTRDVTYVTYSELTEFDLELTGGGFAACFRLLLCVVTR